jgi:hypothetical protein
MGAANSTSQDPIHNEATSTFDFLRAWPLEKTVALNNAHRASGAGFVLEAEQVASLLDVQHATAVVICCVLSRNPRKESVNVMTLLAVSSCG